MSNSKIFIPNFECVLTNETDTKTSDMIFILSDGSCPMSGTLGHWGCPGGQFFFQTWSCGISNRRDEQNRMQVTFSS